MRIISAFHDYYDSVAAWDRDATPLYLRSEQCKHEEEDKDLFYRLHPQGLPTINVGNVGAVIFCGRKYPFWEINGHICYTFAQIRKAFVATCFGEHSTIYPNRKRWLAALDSDQVNFYHGCWGQLSRGTFERWSGQYKGVVDEGLFRKYNAPVFAVDRSHSYINPILKRFNFQTVMDPYTAYQELSMFLGNQLAQQVDPIPKVTDELKAHAHGFDQWSFRTHKEDSKKAKKRKAKEAARKEEVHFDDRDFKL